MTSRVDLKKKQKEIKLQYDRYYNAIKIEKEAVKVRKGSLKLIKNKTKEFWHGKTMRKAEQDTRNFDAEMHKKLRDLGEEMEVDFRELNSESPENARYSLDSPSAAEKEHLEEFISVRTRLFEDFPMLLTLPEPSSNSKSSNENSKDSKGS